MKPFNPSLDKQTMTQLQAVAATLLDPPTCIVRRASDQSIADSADTDIDFLAGATVEVDTHGMFDTGASDRLTVKRAGVHMIAGSVRWASSGVGKRHIWIASGGNTYVYDAIDASVGNDQMSTACIVDCTLGDIIQLFVRQTSTGALDVTATANYSPRLSATWLRS